MYAQMPIRLRRASFATSRIFLAALFLAVLILAVLTFTLPLKAQDPGQSTGVSHPPSDTAGEPNDDSVPIAKPSPSHYQTATTPASQPELLQSAPIPDPQAAEQPAAQATIQTVPPPAAEPALQNRAADPDSGIVGDTARVEAAPPTAETTSIPATTAPATPALGAQAYNPTSDPDGDIVQRHAAPGEILQGTTIRVRLVDRLSSASSTQGTPFKSRVVTDIVSDGQILIPAGSEIDGRISRVSSGNHLGASGFMRLRPETIILPDGSRYQISSMVTGTPGSKTKLSDEGTIKAGSRMKRDTVEYAGVVGAGAATGAILGGPIGAVTGSAVGAGIVTTHLLVNHAQAVLEPGTVLLITLISPLQMNPMNTVAQN